MLMKLISRVSRMADYLTAATFFLMSVGVLLAVFGRYLFRYPLPGAMEVAYFAMLWCVFLQTGTALSEDRHVAMSFIKDRLSSKAKPVVGMSICLIILITVVFLTWYSASFTWESFIHGWRTAGAIPVPIFLLYGIMALGSLYLGIIAIVKIIEHGKALAEADGI
jgi:TRAP-type C4-dicarboxylate transport system permease small subunit